MTQQAPRQTKALTPMQDIQNTLNSNAAEFEKALPAHVTAEKFIRVTLTCIQNTPTLLECDRASLYSACKECAADGLLPDGREAAIIPFRAKGGGTEAVYMPMVGGLLKMMRNSGELSSITPNIVCEKDSFDYFFDDEGEHIMHRPFLTGARGDVTHAYCIARMKDGTKTFEVMSRAEIDAVRESSKAKDSGPWKDWFGEMAKKTVIRRISKRLAMSTEIDRALHRDDALYDLDKSSGHKSEGPKKSRLEGIIDSNQPAPLEIELGSAAPGGK